MLIPIDGFPFFQRWHGENDFHTFMDEVVFLCG